MSNRNLLDEIEEALERATERPWEWEAADASVVALGTAGKVFDTGHVLWSEVCPACQERGNRCTAPSPENAKLIELAVNNAKPLLAVVRAAAETELLSGPEGATVAETKARRQLREKLRTLDPRLLGES